ncbi:toll/interleukin-1 receptor domain-containing protein [Rhodoblastus sp.]|uniref:toll/interleukin-1 receptor domain-containing protein n=1 Tax=Rhodoblastus sp. TaxID=1962975 RepID=UPI003F9BCA59
MTFTLKNSIDISDGAVTRRIALYEGDLTAIPREHRSDFLVISAFPDDYLPTGTSVIGALHRKGLSVKLLAANKAHDLRATSAFWISQPLSASAPHMNIGQIACFEPSVLGSPPTVVGDLFRGLFPFLDERRNHVVTMPVLASGDQGWPPEVMLHAMLNAATHWLARGLAISELKIVTPSSGPAATLSAAFEDFKSKLSIAALKPSKSDDYDVFLSFSTADAVAADCARQALQTRADAKRIFDFRLSIDKGKSWQEELDRAIGSSRNIIAILSPAYFASNECREELMQARLRNKREANKVLFPIYWQNWGKELDLWLQILNYADCREADAQVLAATISTLVLA